VTVDNDEFAGPDGRGEAGEKGRFRHLFDNVQDAVVEFDIEDGEPIVRHVNPAFVAVFGYERAEIVDESLNEYIVPDARIEEAATFDSRTGAGEHNKAVVRRETATGMGRFLYRGVPYEGWDGTARGFAIYSDITDQTRREHRLQVLHRVLRHNLRNEVNVVDACAELLADELDDERLSELAGEIRHRAANLEHLSDEAGRVNRVLDDAAGQRRTIELDRAVARVVDEASDRHPDAEFRREIPASFAVSATPHLELAVAELLDNAARHNSSDSPQVVVSASTDATDDWVRLSVADDGPAIPAAEQRTATTDADPTQLEHGSGLGLLLVRWITDAAGGTVEIGERDGGGNVVTLRLKRATPCEPGP
jgi:PAS domain S-box-containing protein